MAARTDGPPPNAPSASDDLQAFGGPTGPGGLPQATAELAHLRASQIRGCCACIRMHTRDLAEAGESDERIRAVETWRDAPFFTGAERAALAVTETVARLGARGDPVPEEVFDEAAKHFEEPGALAALILHITLIDARDHPGRCR